MTQTKETVAVVGLGRFGRFWAEMISPAWTVVGTSRREIVDLPSGVVQKPLPQALHESSIVFLTVSISSLSAVLPELAPHLRPDTTVVDTCSVKTYPVEQMQQHLPEHIDIVACHPMFGPDSARERRDSLPVILWPVRDSHGRFSAITDAFTTLGMRPEIMSPEEHDREAAETQGVTHLIGRVLERLELQPSTIATLGYTRLMQVMEQTCNDPVELFRDLQRYNPYTRSMRQRLRDALIATEELLETRSTDET